MPILLTASVTIRAESLDALLAAFATAAPLAAFPAPSLRRPLPPRAALVR